MSKAALTIACLALFAAVDGQASHAQTPTAGVDPVRWASFEYVNLWTSAPPLRFPLITTGDAASGGRLGAPGTRVLLGDPGRSYFPPRGVEKLATYEVPTSRDLEDREMRETSVYRLLPR